MSSINWKRVILGGLLAGLVINVLEALVGMLLLGSAYEERLAELGLAMPTSAPAMVYFVALGFLFGIAIVWLYAAIRPRYGPGPRTAIIAGLAAWLFTGLIHILGEAPLGILTTGLYVKWVIAWIIELPLAALAGAWLYQEGATEPGPAAEEPRTPAF